MRRQGDSTVTIVSLFPALLGTYGDGGNVLVLRRRCGWRGLAARVVVVDAGDPVPVTGDLYLIGGGEDSGQLAAMAALRASTSTSGALGRAIDGGAQVLAVCAGLQLLGHHFLDGAGTTTAGLGLLDITTGRLPARAVGEVLARPAPELGLPTLSGFENHAGHTVLGAQARPLATVLAGTGNGPDPAGAEATEGVVTDNILATYLHGPVLARNPHLADLLISRALGVAPAELPQLDIQEHEALRERLTPQLDR